MFRRHSGAPARWYGQHFRDLAERLGPFDAVTRFYAGAAAALWVTFRQATQTLEEAQRARQNGRGRRPNVQTIRALEKRQGLAWQSYDGAQRRLEDLAARSHKAQSPMQALAGQPEVTE